MAEQKLPPPAALANEAMLRAIRALKERRGIRSMREVAKLSGIAYGTFQKRILGTQSFDLPQIWALARALHVSPRELMADAETIYAEMMNDPPETTPDGDDGGLRLHEQVEADRITDDLVTQALREDDNPGAGQKAVRPNRR